MTARPKLEYDEWNVKYTDDSVNELFEWAEEAEQEIKELRGLLEKFLSVAKSKPEDCKNATHFYYLLVEADDLVKEAEQALNKEK